MEMVKSSTYADNLTKDSSQEDLRTAKVFTDYQTEPSLREYGETTDWLAARPHIVMEVCTLGLL